MNVAKVTGTLRLHFIFERMKVVAGGCVHVQGN